VMFQVEVFWVVTPCSVVVWYQLFTLKMEVPWTAETLVSYHITTRRYNIEDTGLERCTVASKTVTTKLYII
jgi:hypothetical protein